jgi:hypothetical protein
MLNRESRTAAERGKENNDIERPTVEPSSADARCKRKIRPDKRRPPPSPPRSTGLGRTRLPNNDDPGSRCRNAARDAVQEKLTKPGAPAVAIRAPQTRLFLQSGLSPTFSRIASSIARYQIKKTHSGPLRNHDRRKSGRADTQMTAAGRSGLSKWMLAALRVLMSTTLRTCPQGGFISKA